MSTTRTALAAAGAALLLAACGTATPGASPHPSPTPSGWTTSPSPTTTPPASPSPSQSPSHSATSPRPTSAPATPTPSATGLPAALLGQDITAIPTSARVVALTFDAGGNADGVPAILATLRAKGVTGTFFLTGAWTRVYPASAADIVAAGHLVGNHTDTHPHFGALTPAQRAAEVEAGAAAVTEATGVDPRPYFRFPFGERTAADVRQLNDLGYLCVSWTVDTVGWKGTSGGQSVDSVLARVLDGLRPGEIVLMHVGSHPTDGSTLDADALGRVIDALRARGYGFVTLAALTS